MKKLLVGVTIMLAAMPVHAQMMTPEQRSMVAQQSDAMQRQVAGNYAYVEPSFLLQQQEIAAPAVIFDEDSLPAKEAEAENNPETAFTLGYMYNFGKNVRVDDQKTLFFYQKAANAGHLLAKVTLGRIYKFGGPRQTIPVDMGQAVYWFRNAAESGSADGWYELGQLFETGAGVPQNDQFAITAYQKAADAGNFNALIKLALFAQYGRGMPVDWRKAVEYLRKAEDMKQDEEIKNQVQELLGNIYADVASQQTDQEKILTWRKLAATHFNTYSQVALGDMYSNGSGVPQDMQEAAKWYELAATQQFDIYAMGRLGFMYSNGVGNVERDYTKAFRWYKEAAENGSAEAAWNIGNMYYSGLGVAKDQKEANKWFERSKTLTKR